MLMVGEAERRSRFGYALEQALAARGVSARQLAQRLGIDARQVARWRTGKGLPDLYQTQALVSVLRVDEELFRNPPEVPKAPAYPIERYLLPSGDQIADQAADDAVDEAPAPQRPVATPGRRTDHRPAGEPS